MRMKTAALMSCRVDVLVSCDSAFFSRAYFKRTKVHIYGDDGGAASKRRLEKM